MREINKAAKNYNLLKLPTIRSFLWQKILFCGLSNVSEAENALFSNEIISI